MDRLVLLFLHHLPFLCQQHISEINGQELAFPLSRGKCGGLWAIYCKQGAASFFASSGNLITFSCSFCGPCRIHVTLTNWRGKLKCLV